MLSRKCDHHYHHHQSLPSDCDSWVEPWAPSCCCCTFRLDEDDRKRICSGMELAPTSTVVGFTEPVEGTSCLPKPITLVTLKNLTKDLANLRGTRPCAWSARQRAPPGRRHHHRNHLGYRHRSHQPSLARLHRHSHRPATRLVERSWCRRSHRSCCCCCCHRKR